MAELISLCTDVASEADDTRSSKKVVLEDVLVGLVSHRILKHVDDNQLKSVLKSTNQLLNERKTRTRGLMLFENFIRQVNPDRLVAVQDSFVSSLSLISKCADLELTHRILTTLIPMCHKLPEFNQCVASTILPKVMVHFCEKTDGVTEEEVEALVMLLERYRGPCGSYRNQLERILVPYIDGQRDDLKTVAKIFPLLSCVGGGGNKGEKYSDDWGRMVKKILITMYDTLVSLCGDVCPVLENNNPYRASESDTEGGLDLPGILSPDVLVRSSSLSRRLCNLTSVLGAYLSEPFPAAKPMPIRGVSNIMCSMLLVNPVGLLKNVDAAVPKENVFLSALLPNIIIGAFNLLGHLTKSCGSYVFPEMSRIELQIIQQLKWIAEKPQSFEDVKIALYEMLTILLKTTGGYTSNENNAHAIATQIFRDIAIEKQSVTLSKSLNQKGKRLKSTNGQVTAIINSSGQVRVEIKSEAVCRVALETLKLLLPSLNEKHFREAYVLVASNTWDFLRSSEPLSPYCSGESRQSAFSCLAEFAINPNPKSPVSLGLIVNLLELGSKDRLLSVSHHCESLLRALERVVHPPCASLNFPVIVPSTTVSVPVLSSRSNTVADESESELLSESEDINEEEGAVVMDSVSQTEECDNSDAIDNRSYPNLNTSLPLDTSMIKEAVAEALKDNLDEFRQMLSKSVSPSVRHSRRPSYENTYKSDEGSSTEEEISTKRRKLTRGEEVVIKPKPSHLVPAEQVHKELRIPLPKTNGYSHCDDLDDDSIDVSVEEMLLSFDDQVVVSNKA